MRTALLLLAIAAATHAAEPDLDLLIQNAHWRRARTLAEADCKAHPNDARSAWRLARVRLEFQNVDDAVKYAELAVRLDPHTAAYHRLLGESYAKQIGKLPFYKQLGQSHKIRSEYDAALAIAPTDPDTVFDQIDYLLDAPGIAGGDSKKAADLANRLLKVDPAHGYLALSRVARKQNENDKLPGLYQKAVESDARNYTARMLLASFYADAAHQDFGLMERHALAAIDINPDRIGGYRVLALALASQKRLGDAAKLLARSEAAVPDDLSPYVYAARAMLSAGIELPRAEEYLRKYIAATSEPEPGAPLIAGAHWSLALVHEKQGRPQDARSELETALRLKSDFEPARLELKRLTASH